MATDNFNIEPMVADALLDVGASIPLKTIQIPFFKKPVKLRVTMKRPCLGNQIRIAKLYLAMGVTCESLQSSGRDGNIRLMAKHGAKISQMVALTLCRGYITGWLLARPVAWMLRWFVEDVYMEAAYEQFVLLLGTRSFGNIIKSAEMTNPLSPLNVSHKRKRS